MTTVSTLVDQIVSHLHSFTGVTEATTYLIDDLLPNDTNILVQHPVKITQGFIEVEDELMHVSAVNGNTVEIMPFGRGVLGSTAAAHNPNVKVVNDPLIPRIRVFDAIKRAVLQVQPDLYAVATTTFTFSPVVTTYEIPATVTRILRVQYQLTGPSQEWLDVRHWTMDQNAATVSGKAIVIAEDIQPGRTVQVTYATPYVSPTLMTDDLESTCKIPASAHDVLLYNVAWQITQFMEPYRLQLRSVEQQARLQGIDVGSASKVAQQMYAMYELRKREERARLLTINPTVKHYAVR